MILDRQMSDVARDVYPSVDYPQAEKVYVVKPDGRVVSAANWYIRRHGFDSNRSRIFFR